MDGSEGAEIYVRQASASEFTFFLTTFSLVSSFFFFSSFFFSSFFFSSFFSLPFFSSFLISFSTWSLMPLTSSALDLTASSTAACNIHSSRQGRKGGYCS